MGRTSMAIVYVAIAGSAGCALVSGLANLELATDAGSADSGTPGEGGARDAAPDSGSTLCACGGTIPPGFTPVGVTKGQCPPSLDKETVYLDPKTLTASGACTCTCNVGGCTGSTTTFYDATQCFLSLGSVSLNGTCQALSNNVSATSSIKTTGATPSCTMASSFPTPHSGTTRLCTPTNDCTAFCAGGNLQSCYVAPGDVACPTGLTKTLVSASVTDTRSCNGCSCTTSGGGCVAVMTYYTNATCTAGTDAGLTQNVDSCNNTGVSGTYVKGAVTPLGTCTTLPGTADGGTTPTNLRTVCCK